MEETVYRGLTQDALDAQYDQSTLVPDMAMRMANWRRAGEAARARHRPVERRYGPGPDALLDLYGAGGGPAHLHLHGGAWRALSRIEAAIVAGGLGEAVLAVAEFPLAPKARLPEMVAHARAAFAWLHRETGQPVHVSGHSSGAHMAACLMDRDWHRAEDLPGGTLASAVLVSGIYDLAPVRLSARNRYLDLSEEDVAALSATRRDLVDAPVAMLWGENELDEFKQQSRDMARALGGRRAEAAELPGQDHFDMGEGFGDPGHPVAVAARRLMGLATGTA